MNLLEAILSGVLQGLTEFLPVSSSGHLVLLHYYFGYKQPQLLFDTFLHVGTLLAILVYFRKDIWLIFTKQRYFLILILIGCIPTGIIGFLFEPFFRQAFVNIKLAGFMLITTAIFLFCGDFGARLREHHPETRSRLGIAKALIIGTVQGVSALPGLSRSGITISTALICQVRKREAVRYSFLLAIPVIIGTLIFELNNLGSVKGIFIPQVIAGSLCSFLTGLVAIYYLIKAIIKDRLSLFGIYCFLAGAAVLIKVYI
ncbi:MAG: undecaprenyl-diphosphate phosphatase [Candidatus Omnitrophota bacterium]|nr:MAG: undecaprenyl-diphosphate phosphatase [Candidatus Omnitrophota bacterium]